MIFVSSNNVIRHLQITGSFCHAVKNKFITDTVMKRGHTSLAVASLPLLCTVCMQTGVTVSCGYGDAFCSFCC